MTDRTDFFLSSDGEAPKVTWVTNAGIETQAFSANGSIGVPDLVVQSPDNGWDEWSIHFSGFVNEGQENEALIYRNGYGENSVIFTNEANASPRTLPLPDPPNFSGGYQLTVKTLSNGDHVIYSEGHLLRLDSDLSELMASVNMKLEFGFATVDWNTQTKNGLEILPNDCIAFTA